MTSFEDIARSSVRSGFDLLANRSNPRLRAGLLRMIRRYQTVRYVGIELSAMRFRFSTSIARDTEAATHRQTHIRQCRRARKRHRQLVHRVLRDSRCTLHQSKLLKSMVLDWATVSSRRQAPKDAKTNIERDT